MAILCRYRYDALDRLANCEPAAQASALQFYLKNRLTVEIQGQTRRRLFQHDDVLLAQWRGDGGSSRTALLATDRQRSVLQALEGQVQQPMAYTPYGHRTMSSGIAHLPGFNGERLDPVTGHYLLGNGYRAFNPVLMRFNSPDSLSPFGEGGLNGYAYCVGDPVNRADPTGHTPAFLKSLLRGLGVMKKSTQAAGSADNITTAPHEFGMRKIQRLKGNIYSFEDRDTKTINFLAHGSKKLIKGGHRIGSADLNFSPKGLYKMATQSNINFDQYDRIHLIMCNSGNRQTQSFAANLSTLTGKPTTSYINSVRTTPTPDTLKNLIKSKNADVRRNADGTHNYAKEVKIFETSPHEPGSELYDLFEYKPVTYYPP